MASVTLLRCPGTLTAACLLLISAARGAETATMPSTVAESASEPIRYVGKEQPDKRFYDGALRHAVGVHKYQALRANRTCPPEGGARTTFEACADLWRVMGARTMHVGSCGSAAKMKLITNLVLGLNRAALAEGLAFAEAIGIAPVAALEVMAGSMAYSRAMDAKGRKMVEHDFTVQARLSQHLKDVRMMLQAAGEAGMPLPLADTHRRLMEQAEAAGLGELDNSAIIEVLRRRT